MTRVRVEKGSGAKGRRRLLNGLPLFTASLCTALGLAAGDARAAGTAAGTVISNSATVLYSMTGSDYTQSSNTSVLTVDDKVSFTLTAADTARVSLTPGGRGCLTYLLTNTGNGPHDFTLDASVTGIATLDPAAGPAFYADAAGATPLPTDPNAGGLPGISSLLPDAGVTFYLYVTAPAQPVDGQTIDYLVTAEAYQPAHLRVVNPPVKSSTQAAADASAVKNGNLMARYVLLADGRGNGGDADRDGRYAVIGKDGNGATVGFRADSAALSIVKTQTVTDRSGGSQPVVGAKIRYELAVRAAGAGSALGVAITDAVPAHTSYVPGTLKLNGSVLSDAADADAGDVGGTAAGTVTVRLGDLTSATAVQTIAFEVKID